MAITPTGKPAWTRGASHSDYGGHIQKRNYLSRGVIDPLTDVGAEELTRIAADIEAMVRTCPFATITFLCNDSSPAAPTVEICNMMTGVRTVPYSGATPPTGYPSAARYGDGQVIFTFDSSYADAYGVSGAFAPRHAGAAVIGGSYACSTVALNGNNVAVGLWSASGSGYADARGTLWVW